MSGQLSFEGVTGVVETGLTDATLTIVATANSNINVYAVYDSGQWKIKVSDTTYTGLIYYTVEE